MNTNQLQKLYDRLTPRERLAALLEAAHRGDETDREALERAAPKKQWSVSHHYFLSEAFQKLALGYLLIQYSRAVAFYMGQGAMYSLEDHNKEDQAESVYQGMKELAAVIKWDAAAFAEFCKGEGITTEAALSNLIGSGYYSPDAPELVRIDTLPILLKAADIFSPEPPDAGEVAEMAKLYKELLYDHAGEQTGGWG